MKIIIAGGGTGGHLFPAIAMAQIIKSDSPANEVLFLCTERGFDSNTLPKYGFPFKTLPSPRWMGLLMVPVFFANLIRAVFQALRVINEFSPDAVIGAGGYGAFPAIFAGFLLRVPCYLLEQNVLPGRTNRILSVFAAKVFSQWESSKKHFLFQDKFAFTGNPLRSEMTRESRIIALGKLGMENNRTVLLVLGGSQGARFLNKILSDNVDVLKKHSDRIGIIHLTGENDFEAVKEAYDKNGIVNTVMKFCDDMPAAYSAADIALTRAGGTTIAELAHFGIPAIAVPYPSAAENHQMLNAEELECKGAGICMRQSELNRDELEKLLKHVILNKQSLGRMSLAARSMSIPDTNKRILGIIRSSE